MIEMKRAWFNFRRKRRLKPFLLLEIGMVSVRLHAVDASRDPIRINLVRQESMLPGDASAMIEAVEKTLDVNSDIQDLAVVMNSPLIRHHIVATPPMNAAEREKIVLMEMRLFASQGEEAGVISYWPAGKVKENGSNKEYVLCAEMPRATSEALISAAREKKLNLIGLTSHPQLASHLLKECRPDGVSNPALVEVNEHEGSITLFHSNIWNMERQFLIGGNALAGSETPAALDMDKLKLEVGRALQYFKQQVRNENINQIFLYGTTSQTDQISSFLKTAFRIPVVPISLDVKKFAAQNQAGQLISIPHAAALHSHFETYIDFLPREWRIQKQIKFRNITMAASAAALYMLLGGITLLFKQEASQIEKIQNTGVQIRSITAEPSEKVQQIQKSRSFALAAEQSADWMNRRHHALSGFARELAAAMPAEMRITTIEATEKENTWLVKIAAEILSPNGSRSQEIFLQFQERMRRQSNLNHMNWGEVQLADSQSTAVEAGVASKSRNSLTFSMQGAIALNPKI
jgi:hypothetical protein